MHFLWRNISSIVCATNPSSWNKWRSWFVESDVTVWSNASNEQLNPTSLVFNWKAKFILLYVLINNKKETSPQQSSARNQHTPRLNQERCRPERARSRKGMLQSQKSHFTFGSMSMCLKKFCNMYLWYFVWSYQFCVKVTCGSSQGDLPRCRRIRPCWTSSHTWSSLSQPCAPERDMWRWKYDNLNRTPGPVSDTSQGGFHL